MIKATEESCDKTKLSGHYYARSSLTLQYLSAKRACVVDRESASRTRAAIASAIAQLRRR